MFFSAVCLECCWAEPGSSSAKASDLLYQRNRGANTAPSLGHRSSENPGTLLRSKHTSSPMVLTLAHCSTALCKVHSTNATGPNFSWALGYLPGADAHLCRSRVPSSAEKLFLRGSWLGVWHGSAGKAQRARSRIPGASTAPTCAQTL